MKVKFLKATIVLSIILICSLCFVLVGCEEETSTWTDKQNTIKAGNTLAENQPTPTDIDYSLERYNLIRRTYWVNGQREKAIALPCAITKPLGYIVLLTESGAVVGNFIVDGKVSSLNSFLTPDTTSPNAESAKWLPDVDGSYGANDNGIFFFTPDGKYIEWTGIYLYSDIPFTVDDPVLKTE